MSYEIKIGQRSIAITDNVSEVVAPNEQMAILFKGMANIFGDLRAVAMLAEAEADAVEVIRNDPDLNEAAKNRRARDAANRTVNYVIEQISLCQAHGSKPTNSLRLDSTW